MKLTFVGYGGAMVYPCYMDEHSNIYFDTNMGNGTLSLYTGASKDSCGNICGEPLAPVIYNVYPTNTISQYFSRGGKWNVECDTSIPYRFMDVQISFLDANGNDDEVEFSIKSYDKRDLCSLYKDFCKENQLPLNTVKYIAVVRVAETMEDLL